MRKKLYPAVAISFAAASPRNLFGAISCKWNQRRMESAAMLASSNSAFSKFVSREAASRRVVAKYIVKILPAWAFRVRDG